MSIAGPIREVSIKGRVFAAAADADGTRKLGGAEVEVQPNGDGVTSRNVQTLVPWNFDGITLAIDDARGDQEFLQDIADAGVNVPITITMASNITYGADGIVAGELGASSQNGTAGVTLSGPGKLTKQ